MRKSKKSVRLLRLAETDLADILDYIALDNAKAAIDLGNTFERSLNSLSNHPFLGRVTNDEELMKMGYRYLVVQDYLCFYSVEPDCVLIHRIIHGARDFRGLL